MNTVIFDDLSTNNNNHGDKKWTKSANQGKKTATAVSLSFFPTVKRYTPWQNIITYDNVYNNI